jgi:hypothetical protein
MDKVAKEFALVTFVLQSVTKRFLKDPSKGAFKRLRLGDTFGEIAEGRPARFCVV